MFSEALLGTDSGAIYELSVDEGRKERLQKLHELRGEAGPIAGLAQVRGGDKMSISSGLQADGQDARGCFLEPAMNSAACTCAVTAA